MSDSPKLSFTGALVLQAVSAGHRYGFDIMEVTGLPSGTVYPALRRLEQQELVRSRWEREQVALAEQRPPRKYYEVTRQGKDALANVLQRYTLLDQLSKPETPRSR
jgi:PadR family transcriptional regulator PadR